MIETIKDGEVFRLADKVEYRKGTYHPVVVDRNDGGEHTLIAVDEGAMIPDHEAPADIIFYALEGSGILQYDGVDYTIRAGENFFLRKGTLHHVKALTKFKFSLVRFY